MQGEVLLRRLPLKWQKLLLVMTMIVVLVASVLIAFDWYTRSNRHVLAAVAGSEGDLYVLLESHMEGQRFHLLMYRNDQGFESPNDISIESMPGCDRDDPIVIKDIATDPNGISVLGSCAWSDTTSVIWTYSSARHDFRVAIELRALSIDKAVSLGEAGPYKAAVTDIVEGDRFCGRLSLLSEDGSSQVDYRSHLQEGPPAPLSCPSGVWNLASTGSMDVSFLVKERETEYAFLCTILDLNGEPDCQQLGEVGYEECQFNPESQFVACLVESKDIRYHVFAFDGEGTPVAECVGMEADSLVIPLDTSNLAVVSATGVETHKCRVEL